MAKYAHIIDGRVIDPHTNENVAEYKRRFGPLADEWDVIEVPDDTEPGAVDNGSGSYTNPAIPTVTPAPRVLSKTAFQDYAVSQLGGVPDGMARFTAIMDATRDSTSGAVRFAYARYEAAQTFEKANTAALTAIMAADSANGHITADERTAILDNWPT